MRSIALTNQKGGVGKTSTAVNLGAALAREGKRVLLVDMDPQANLTSWLLGPASEALEETIADVLTGDVAIDDLVVHTSEDRLDLVPADLRLCGAEKFLSREISAETILRDAFKRADLSPDPADPTFDLYDYILIDCPPSVGLLSINAMSAVEEVIIPLQAQVLALNGLVNLCEVVEKVQERVNPALRITGILLVMVKARTNLAREVEASAREHFPDLVYQTTIRECVRIAECPSHFLTVQQYAASSVAASEYARLATEVLAQEQSPDSNRLRIAGATTAMPLGNDDLVRGRPPTPTRSALLESL